MNIDKAGQLGDFDTITREEYHRVNGTTPAVVVACLECGGLLSEIQIRRGGKFCTQRCSGNYNAPAADETQDRGSHQPARGMGSPGLHRDARRDDGG